MTEEEKTTRWLLPPSDERFEKLPTALQGILLAMYGIGTIAGAVFFVAWVLTRVL